MNSTLSTSKDFYTIAIGSSTGGLKSIVPFFQHILPNTPHAFVLVSHLQRDFESMIDKILAQHTQVPIVKLTKNTKIEPGKIYVLAENTTITCSNGYIEIAVRDKNPVNSAIDIFLKSLATEFKHKAIGIIMSGHGSDGLQGAFAIEREGGLILVQDPESAQAESMPLTTIKFDHPTLIGDPQKLANFVNHIGSGQKSI